MQKNINLFRFDWRNPVSIVLLTLIGCGLGKLAEKYVLKAPIFILGLIITGWMLLSLDVAVLLLFALPVLVMDIRHAFLAITLIAAVPWALMVVKEKPNVIKTLYSPQFIFMLSFFGLIYAHSLVLHTSFAYLLKNLLKFFVIYIIAVTFIRSPGQLKKIIYTMVAAGAILSFTGLVENVLQTSVFVKRPLPPSTGFQEVGIISSSLVQFPNDYALRLMFLLVLGIGVMFSLSEKDKKLPWSIAMGIIFLGIVISLNRSAYVSLAAICLIIFFGRASWKMKRFILLLFLFSAPFMPWRGFVSRIFSVYYGTVGTIQDYSWSIRLKLWEIGWGFFKSSPLYGIGVNQELKAISFLGEVEIVELAQAAGQKLMALHNVYLTVGVQMGLIGLFIYLSIIFFSLKDLIWCKKHFKAKNNIDMYYISWAFQLSFISILIFQVAQPVLYHFPFWFLVILIVVLKRIAIMECLPSTEKTINESMHSPLDKQKKNPVHLLHPVRIKKGS